MNASDWFTESAKGLFEILVKGAFSGGIIGGLSGIIAAGAYNELPAKSYRCVERGGWVDRTPDFLGRPPTDAGPCIKIVDGGVFGDWSSGTSAAFQVGVIALVTVLLVSVVILLYRWWQGSASAQA